VDDQALEQELCTQQGEWPLIHERFAQGRLSYSKVRAMTQQHMTTLGAPIPDTHDTTGTALAA
jgi:hypothetical protein